MNAREQEVLKVAEQASEWLMAVEEGDQTRFAALADWLRESPLHIEMFLQMAAVERLVDAVPTEERDAIRAGIAADADTNVTPFKAIKTIVSAPQGGPKKWARSRVLGLAASVAIAAAALGWAAFEHANRWEQFATPVGEQRSLALPDGSVVYLNADSRVEVKYSDKIRNLHLVSGEALFKVQHDASRPFRVWVDDAVVQALGTQFNIYRRPTQTTVVVIEGAVQIEQPALSYKPERLMAGEGAVLAGGSRIDKRAAIDVEKVMAWRQRRLIFRWASLDEIVQEFNRYNQSPRIRIDSTALRERRYTAVFDADSPQELLNFLQRDESVKVWTEGAELVIRAP